MRNTDENENRDEHEDVHENAARDEHTDEHANGARSDEHPLPPPNALIYPNEGVYIDQNGHIHAASNRHAHAHTILVKLTDLHPHAYERRTAANGHHRRQR